MTQEKLKESGKKFIRSIDRDLPVAVLDKRELDTRLAGVRAKLVSAKEQLESLSTENQKVTRRNTRIQVILEQTEEFQAQLKRAKLV